MTVILEMLAAKGLTLLRNAIVAKGKEFIEEKIGMKIPDNPTEEELISLKIREMEHEETLLSLGIEDKKLDVEDKKLDVENTVSARSMNSDIQTSAYSSALAKNVPYWLDIGIVLGTVLVAILVIFVDISDTNKEIAFMALGSLMTLSANIVNFHRGTSSSSRAKDDTIKMLQGIK